MNVLILNAANTYNYGSMMMAENLIYYSKKYNDSIKFYVMADALHTDRLRNASTIDDITPVSLEQLLWCGSVRAAMYLSRMGIPVASALMRSMDRVYFLGGDDFTEIYGRSQLEFCLRLVSMLKSKRNYFALVGQTVGPFGKDIEQRALSVFRRMDMISLRDPESMEYMKNAGMRNIESVTDLALLPLAKEESRESVSGNTVLFCPSQIMHSYAKVSDQDSFKLLNEKICRYILQARPDFRIVVLAHVYDDRTRGDVAMAEDLYGRLQDCGDRVELIRGPVYPYEVRQIIKGSAFIVAERMHPAISGLECVTPSLVFSYGRKYEGIFEKLYALDKTVIDMRKYDDYELLWQDVRAALDYIMSHERQLREHIARVNAQTQPQALKHIERLAR